jgi:putative endonuclease
MWYVYIIICKDKSLYTGMTNDIERRFKQHKSGHGSKYVRSRGVKKLAYTEVCRTKRKAMKREIEIKGFSRQKKLELIK